MSLICPHPDCHQPILLPTECPHCRRSVTTALAAPAETVDFLDGKGYDTASYHPAETVDSVPTSEQRAGELPAQLGRFRVRQRLGEGAFGVVYRAYDPQLDREVALKVAKANQLATPQRIQRFLREARAAGNLRHPNIVPVHDSGQEGSLYYIASAFIAGQSADRLLASKSLERRQGVQIVRRVAEALAYAHRRGIVHRDVKPANVMLEESGEPLLMDFGLAAREEAGAEKLTQDGVSMGTPAFMAPEQAEGTGIAASDQYSLGCMLYEVLTGRTPFQGSPHVQMQLHRTQEPLSPRRLQPDLPRDLETICLKCLEKEPTRRYPDCQALADDLRRWLEGEPILARPLGIGERLAKWARRNPAVATLTATVFLALGLGLAGSLWQMDRANGEANRAEKNATEASEKATAATIAEKKAAENLKDAQQQKSRADGKAAEAATQAARAEKNATEASEKATAATIAEKKAADNLKIAEEQRTRAETQLVRAEGLVYAGKLALAQEAFQTGDGLLALQHLEECQWDRRGWEHRQLWTRVNSNRSLQGHTGGVHAVSFSADGTRILSASNDKTVKVWDANTGKELLSLKGHTFGVTSACFSPDGKRIVSGGGEDIDKPGEIKVWDADTGKELFRIKGQKGWVQSVAFSPDGKSIVSGGGDLVPGKNSGEVIVWNATNGQRIRALKGQQSLVHSVSFSPDGKRILSAGGDFDPDFGGPGEVKVWDAESGQRLLAWEERQGEVHCACFSPDGKQVVTVAGDRLKPGTVKIWDAASGKELRSFKGHTRGIACVAFSADGKRLVSAGHDQLIKVWDAVTGGELLTLTGQQALSAAFSPDGTSIVSGGGDMAVKIWDATRGQQTLTFTGHRGSVISVGFSRDSTRLVSGCRDHTIRVWDVVKGQEIATLGNQGEVYGAAISPDGKRVVSCGEAFKMWDVETKKVLFTLRDESGRNARVALSPDGKRIATGGLEKSIKLWDAQTGQQQATINIHPARILSLSFSPDGKRLLSSSWDAGKPGEVKVWDLDAAREVLTLSGVAADCSCFSPDGLRIVAGGRTVHDAETGKVLFTLKGHINQVTGVCYSPDGSRIVTGSADKTVKIWDASRGEELFTFKELAGWVNGVAFSPDGQRLACAIGDELNTSKAGEVKVWEATKTPEFFTLIHYGSTMSIAYSKDGSRIVGSGGVLGKLDVVKVWDARKGLELFSLEKHKGPVWYASVSADGKRIVSAGNDQTVRMWDGDKGEELLTLKGHTAPIGCVAISPDGTRIVSASNDQTVKVWDAQTGAELHTLKGHTYWVHRVAFSPDGKRIVSGSGNNNTEGEIKVWDAETGKEVLNLKGLTGRVTSVKFSPDGKRIVGASGERGKPGQVKVWDAATGQELLALKGLTNWVSSVEFSPDGKRIVTGGGEEQNNSGALMVWDAGQGQLLYSFSGQRSMVYGVAFSPDGKRLVVGGRDYTLRVWPLPPVR